MFVKLIRLVMGKVRSGPDPQCYTKTGGLVQNFGPHQVVWTGPDCSALPLEKTFILSKTEENSQKLRRIYGRGSSFSLFLI